MSRTPEYKAFDSCQGVIFDGITASPSSITPLALRLSGKLLTTGVLQEVTNERNTPNDRVNKIFMPLLQYIKQDTNFFYFFVKQLEEVGFTKEAEKLRKGLEDISESC